MGIVLAVIGFMMLYVYDINSITIKSRLLSKLFFGGFLMISLGTLSVVMQNYKDVSTGSTFCMGMISIIIFLSMLVYTLFFAIPFEDTYKKSKYKICDKGMYALCRHPGVLWFAGAFSSLFIIFQNTEVLLFCCVTNLMNVIYIILQDIIVFPKIFEGYDRYRKTTPFLIPNKQSVIRFMKTIREVAQ